MSEYLSEGPRLIDSVVTKVRELMNEQGLIFAGVEDFYSDEDVVQIWVYVESESGFNYKVEMYEFSPKEFQVDYRDLDIELLIDDDTYLEDIPF